MVSLEKNDHLMLARQLPLKSVALILAGGRGTRLKDLTNKRAKPTVHFGGKFRIIDFALSNCINSGIRRMGVITQYQSHTLVQHIQRGWSFFNEEMNEFVDLLPAQQRMKGENWYRGTADAVTQNLDIIRRYKAEYVVIWRATISTSKTTRVCLSITSKKAHVAPLLVCQYRLKKPPHLALWRLMRTIKLSNSLKNLLTRRQCRTIRANLWRVWVSTSLTPTICMNCWKKTIAMRTPATTLAKI